MRKKVSRWRTSPRRLPVINRDKRLVGILALGNISESGDNDACHALLQGVATPH